MPLGGVKEMLSVAVVAYHDKEKHMQYIPSDIAVVGLAAKHGRGYGDRSDAARRHHIRSLGGVAARQRRDGEALWDIDRPGPYLVLMKWNPGWFSAPHSYATDRIQMVMSGTWWVSSGADFTPDMAVPVPAGGYVKRTARTFHYDGVPHGIKEPVVIAIFGIGPVDIRLADPHLPRGDR
jgi:hypothetical protein